VLFTLILNISSKSPQNKKLASDKTCDRLRKRRVIVGWTILTMTTGIFFKEIPQEENTDYKVLKKLVDLSYEQDKGLFSSIYKLYKNTLTKTNFGNARKKRRRSVAATYSPPDWVNVNNPGISFNVFTAQAGRGRLR
jgi:hypothetical protein